MRITITTWLAGVALCTMSIAAQAPPSREVGKATPAQAEEGASTGGSVSSELVGTWKSTPLSWPLTGEFEESVWGRNASSTRTVDLVVKSSGDATLTVTTKILDAKGRTVRGPTAIETSQLKIGPPGATSAVGTDHEVTVVKAVRRYPDDPVSEWAMDGLKVRLITKEKPGSIELRYDTPEGRGSFWETLTSSPKASRPASKTTTRQTTSKPASKTK